ncbi:MAG: hypothetical protein GQE15_05735 [Archangiaceae bacterium]|nr:hypothetical protein [Archangiaceae bacterium]
MSRKLIIVVAVQSALVLGLGGLAVGVSMSGGDAPPAAHAKKKAPPSEDDAAAEEDAEPEPAPPPKKKKSAHAKAEAVKAAREEPEDEDAEPAPKPDPHAKPAKTDAHAKAEKPEKAEKADPHARVAEGAKEELTPLLAPVPKDPLEVFAWLDEGNTRWSQGVSKSRDVVAQRGAMAKAFAPWAVVLTCADGRAVPEAVFDAPPGTLATLRAVVLKADAPTVNSVELAMKRFSPPVLVVLGHQGCDDGSGRDVGEQVTQVTAKVLGKKLIRDRMKGGQLLVLRATYDLESGRVRWLDSEEGKHDKSASAEPAHH